MELNNKNNVILNSLAEGVITVDKDFKITFFNDAAEKITGFERDKVIGNICKNIFKSEFCFSNCPIASVISFRDVSILKKIEGSLGIDSFFMGIIGTTKEMKDLFKSIEEISSSDVPVFIRGETGTGKELFANAIQQLSKRKNNKFVEVNCSIMS